jgi:hypothetical protein
MYLMSCNIPLNGVALHAVAGLFSLAVDICIVDVEYYRKNTNTRRFSAFWDVILCILVDTTVSEEHIAFI